VRTKTQILKTASTLKAFSGKIKKAQDDGTLTPEVVQEIADEIKEITEVATELAEEIAEGVPAEEGRDALSNREEDPKQIEVAADETEEEKKKRLEKEKTAQDEDDDKKEDKEKIEKLEASLAKMERKSTLQEIAPKYASLFPKSMHEAKMNEILNSKESVPILEAKLKEASDIITNKTMVKIASMNDSIFDIGDSESEEVNIAAKM